MASLCASAVLCAVHALRPEECTWSRATVQQFTLCKMQDCCLKGTGWGKSCGCCSAAGQVGSPPEQHPLRPGMPGRKHQRPLKVLTYTCADRGS